MQQEKRWKKRSRSSRDSGIRAASRGIASEAELYAFAVNQLSRKPHPTSDLRKKLLCRCEDAARVESILQQLTDRGYLNDRSYAELFASTRRSQKLLSRSRIKRELESRSLNTQLIDEVLDEIYPSADEEGQLQQALSRKLKGIALPVDAKKLTRLYNYLHRLGFESDAIVRELNKRFKSNVELE